MWAKFLLKDNPDGMADSPDRGTRLAGKLMELSQRCRVSAIFSQLTVEKGLTSRTTQDHQLSGRALRKLPVLAYAMYGVVFNQGATPRKGEFRSGTPVETWLDAMEMVIDDKGLEREKMEL